MYGISKTVASKSFGFPIIMFFIRIGKGSFTAVYTAAIVVLIAPPAFHVDLQNGIQVKPLAGSNPRKAFRIAKNAIIVFPPLTSFGFAVPTFTCITN